MNDTSESDKWVVTVYDGMDKIATKNFTGEEDEVYEKGKQWVAEKYSTYDNWTVHHVI